MMVSDVEFVIVNVVEFAFFVTFSAFYAWLFWPMLRQQLNIRLAERRLAVASKKAERGEYFDPPGR